MSKKEDIIEDGEIKEVRDEEKPAKKEEKPKLEIKKTTVWLDLLTYLLIPLITIMGLFQVIRTLLVGNILGATLLVLLVKMAFIVYQCITLFHVHTRNKKGYLLIRGLIYAHAIYQGIYWGIVEHVNKDANVFLSALTYIGICVVAFIIPNEMYFKSRKNLFKNEITLKETIEEHRSKKQV